MSEPTYRVTLRSEGKGPPTIVRLRNFLKMALRAYGLRCTDIEEVKEPKMKAQ